MLATYGNFGYNMLRGPAWQNWDMSLQKNTIWNEQYRLQLRIDSFNVFNHPNFASFGCGQCWMRRPRHCH